MWKKSYFLGLIILFGILTPAIVNCDGISVVETSENWSNYQQISEQNTNATLPSMSVDKNNNTHILWATRSMVANESKINYRISYKNGDLSEIETVISIEDYTVISFKAIIDTEDRIHLVYYNMTSAKHMYLLRNDTVWEQKGELGINDVQDFDLLIDSRGYLHLIYYVNNQNLYDIKYMDEIWRGETQITDYIPGENEHIWLHGIKSSAGLDGKITILYTVVTLTIGKSSEYRVVCKTYDKGWQTGIILCEYLTSYDLAHDDSGKLHLIWADLTEENMVNYQTYENDKWSKIKKVELFEFTDPVEYVSYYEVKITIQGNTRLISFTPTKMVDSLGFDWDFYIATSTDGKYWDKKPVYRENETRTNQHLITSDKAGTVYALSIEEVWQTTPSNSTLYFGSYENYFTYKTTHAAVYPTIFIIIGLIPLILIKKSKRYNS